MTNIYKVVVELLMVMGAQALMLLQVRPTTPLLSSLLQLQNYCSCSRIDIMLLEAQSIKQMQRQTEQKT